MKYLLLIFLLVSCIDQGDVQFVPAETSDKSSTGKHSDTSGTEDLYDWRVTTKEKILDCYDFTHMEEEHYQKTSWVGMSYVCQWAIVNGYRTVTITSSYRPYDGSDKSQHGGNGAFDWYAGGYTGNEVDDEAKIRRDCLSFHRYLVGLKLTSKAGHGCYIRKECSILT